MGQARSYERRWRELPRMPRRDLELVCEVGGIDVDKVDAVFTFYGVWLAQAGYQIVRVADDNEQKAG